MNKCLFVSKLFLSIGLLGVTTLSFAKGHKVVTGNGQHRFEINTHWQSFSDGNEMGSTHGGVAVDKNGNVYVTTDKERGIAVFSSGGKFLRKVLKGINKL